MSIAKKGVYSVWLTPEGAIRKKIITVTQKLAEEYQAPKFEPHITIVPDYDAYLEKLKDQIGDQVRDMNGLDVVFKGPLTGLSYYRCVFMLAEVSEGLRQLFSRVRMELDAEIPDLFPHMSLIYGDFDESLKTDISKRTDELLNKAGLLPLKFRVSKITLFDTKNYEESQDRISKWKYAGEVRFGQNQSGS